MGRLHVRAVLPLALLAAVASAQNTVYVTDLSIYTLLAPCAQSAISYGVMRQTASLCGEAAPDLQSCVCSKNNNIAAVSSTISSDLSWSCGSTASEDYTSAFAVLNQYCTPAVTAAFPTPTGSLVTDYITDLAAFSFMPKCAQSAMSYAVMSATNSICPEPASQLAPCVCAKNQNSLRISQAINTSVKYSCSSNAADLSTAQALFAAYCDMNKGTTSFATPSDPPGQMTYYITALPQYSALVPCAQSGLSYGMRYLTSSLCPEGPMAVASCACIKSGMSNLFNSDITSSVKYYCTSTATEDIQSAAAVFGFYCSAARAEVVATVSESIAQTYATPKSGTGPLSGPQATSTGANGINNANNNGGGNGNGSSGSTNIAVVVGAAVGVVGALALVGILGFFLWRRNRRNRDAPSKPEMTAALGGNSPGTSHGDIAGGKPELDSTALAIPPSSSPGPSGATAGLAPPGSPHPSSMGNSPRTDTVSPVSAARPSPGPFAPPPMSTTPTPSAAELHNQPYQPMPSELQGQQAYRPMPPELQGQQQMYGAPAPGQYGPPPNGPPLPPELQAQYARPPGQPLPSELQGAGQYAPPPMAQPYPPQAYGQPIHEFPAQNQIYEAYGKPAAPPAAELQGGGWQSGPVAGYHEMDGRAYSGQYRPR